MEVVSAIVGGAEAIWLAWVADYCVEVQDCVEMAFAANPLVNGLTIGFGQRAGMIVIRADVRRDRRADYAESVSVGADDDLLVRGEDPMHALGMRCLRYFSFAG